MVVGSTLGHRLRECTGEHRVDLDGQYLRVRLEQSQRQRAEAWSHLEHDITGSDFCETHNAAHGVGIDDEVLAPTLGGPDTELVGEATNRGWAKQLGHENSRGPHTGHCPAPERV